MSPLLRLEAGGDQHAILRANQRATRQVALRAGAIPARNCADAHARSDSAASILPRSPRQSRVRL